MEPLAVAGMIFGVMGLLLAIAATVWGVNYTRRNMHHAARADVIPLPKTKLKQLLLQLNRAKHPFHLHASSQADLVSRDTHNRAESKAAILNGAKVAVGFQ